MKSIMLNSPSAVGMQVDALEQGSSLAQRPESSRQRIVAELRAMQAVYDDAAKTVTDAVASRELTVRGIKEATKRAIRTAQAEMKQYEDKAAAAAAGAAALRAKAIEPPAGERTVEVLMLEREVRDRLAGKDPLEVNVVYLSAIERQDWTTVNAIERAPNSFALLTREQLDAGAAMRLVKSPLAGQVAEADADAYFLRPTVGAVHAELNKLAEQHHVTPDDSEE